MRNGNGKDGPNGSARGANRFFLREPSALKADRATYRPSYTQRVPPKTSGLDRSSSAITSRLIAGGTSGSARVNTGQTRSRTDDDVEVVDVLSREGGDGEGVREDLDLLAEATTGRNGRAMNEQGLSGSTGVVRAWTRRRKLGRKLRRDEGRHLDAPRSTSPVPASVSHYPSHGARTEACNGRALIRTSAEPA